MLLMLSLKKLWKYNFLLNRIKLVSLFIYNLYASLSPAIIKLFLTLIDLLKPLVIQGLERFLLIRGEGILRGACLFISLFTF